MVEYHLQWRRSPLVWSASGYLAGSLIQEGGLFSASSSISVVVVFFTNVYFCENHNNKNNQQYLHLKIYEKKSCDQQANKVCLENRTNTHPFRAAHFIGPLYQLFFVSSSLFARTKPNLIVCFLFVAKTNLFSALFFLKSLKANQVKWWNRKIYFKAKFGFCLNLISSETYLPK